MTKPALLFVCLGNICRSPLAEGAFRYHAEKAGLDCLIDSCGTAAYHVGAAPDPRSIAEAARRGVDIAGLQGRQLCEEDFSRFTHILAMDRSNLRNIKAAAPQGSSAAISLFLKFHPEHPSGEIEDPYYGGEDGFARTWREVDGAARGLVEELLRE